MGIAATNQRLVLLVSVTWITWDRAIRRYSLVAVA